MAAEPTRRLCLVVLGLTAVLAAVGCWLCEDAFTRLAMVGGVVGVAVVLQDVMDRQVMAAVQKAAQAKE